MHTYSPKAVCTTIELDTHRNYIEQKKDYIEQKKNTEENIEEKEE